MIKQYRHREGFGGIINFVEVAGDEVTAVRHDGQRTPCIWITAADVRSFVELGWWVECGKNATPPGPDYRQ